MSNASSLYNLTVEALEEADATLNSVPYMLLEPSAPADEQARSAQRRIDVGIALQKLRTAEINAIAADLEANADEIKNATRDLKTALERFQAIKPILDGLTDFLKVLGRIIALV